VPTPTGSFKAFRISQSGDRISGAVVDTTLDELTPGDVVIKAEYSSVNYKDALAATGAAKILKKFPLVGGIDVAGVVTSSADPRFKEGDRVVVTGYDLGVANDGGYSAYVRVPADWVVALPSSLTAFEAMALGTAGFTAALAIHRMEQNGQSPTGGPIAVTGASGGVGSLAIDMLSARGYRVTAVSGKADAAPYLRELGASEVLLRESIDFGSRPLENARFGGAIDNLGGDTLAWLTRTVDFWGNIASIGLASSATLTTTVMPFILRGVALLGINSSATRREWRLAVWHRIATDLRPRHLERIVTRTIPFGELPAAFPDYIAGRVTGRTVVRIE